MKVGRFNARIFVSIAAGILVVLSAYAGPKNKPNGTEMGRKLEKKGCATNSSGNWICEWNEEIVYVCKSGTGDCTDGEFKKWNFPNDLEKDCTMTSSVKVGFKLNASTPAGGCEAKVGWSCPAGSYVCKP